MNKKAMIFAIAAGIFWGTAAIFVHIWSANGLTSMQMTAVRVIAAFLCFLIYSLLFNKKALHTRLKDLPLYFGSGISLCGTSAFYFSAIQSTTISTAVTLMYMAPILVLTWSVIFFGEKITLKKAVTVLFMLVGCALTSGIVGDASFNLRGVTMGLLSALSYGTYSILTKLEMRRCCDPVTSTLYSFFFAAASVICICDVSSIAAIFTQRPFAMLPLAILYGVITSVLPYSLYTLSMRLIPAGITASLVIVEPLSATIFSIVIFHEQLSLFSAIGIVLVLASIPVLIRSEQ